MNNPAVSAGARYRSTWQIVREGGAIKVLAAHITWMLGDNEWGRPVWRERAVPPDGKTFQTVDFADYLMLPAREGLGMPSLLTVQKLCEADPRHGAAAIAMLKREIDDYDRLIDRDRNVVLDNAPLIPQHGKFVRGRAKDRPDNVRSKYGNSETYLAARIKRDAGPIWDAYMVGEYRSVRAAAIAAGIVKERPPLTHLRRWWKRASDEERTTFRREIDA